ncbi:MAG: RNA methyltransferase, partial [Prevotellaceae bacterium]|nr:RNA methyltransferase [Prevotellaceae bacterium]
ATELGVDRRQWLDWAFSERRALKPDRLERIVVSAMKQSHKACLPQMGEMMKLKHFLEQPFEGDKFIAHCYAQSDIGETEEKPHLFDVVRADRPTLVLIGPEGDFSVEEVRAAQAAGFRSITLGESRLRTETAALVAVQLMNLKKTMG